MTGKAALPYVAKGVTLKQGKTAAPAGRDLEVYLAHEALGLTSKQGKQLAVRIATNVQPPPPAPRILGWMNRRAAASTHERQAPAGNRPGPCST